ncbi:hypothetical protein N7532_001031 [Penicillium argentinense]|uniref:Xylanolytic transcriptional activator regulatory domain-containing protein n=1 Tax=Penicillium argentinense TaxID=1131581 RepID=A0A9W9G1Y4_9EURO|nr:uncharacterized protein N7532_001031 [Penicillium argentinense]KAJ5110496.1 hypothetical protein N7532_001031 [Penicillium argentinense]
MHGLHRKETTHSLRRSETTHANRLWWTVLMLEKRLMIATGCPFTLDTFIDAPLPSDSPGFPNSAAMQINIQIAQIQTRIYSGTSTIPPPRSSAHLRSHLRK